MIQILETTITIMPPEINLTAINAIYKQGQAYLADGHLSRALRCFYHAWLEIPKPQTDQPIAATILAGIGDSYFKMRKYHLALEALRSALSCPRTQEHTLILLRLGQSLMATGQDEKAQMYLRRAHSIAGNALFANEHPKYLHAIKNSIH